MLPCWRGWGEDFIPTKSCAEQGRAADCLQRPLLRRSRFRQQLSAWRSGSSRQGCASDEVKVLMPSIARFGRLAYPGHGEVTNHERLGRKSHGCHTVDAVAVGATWVASKPAGLNMSE